MGGSGNGGLGGPGASFLPEQYQPQQQQQQQQQQQRRPQHIPPPQDLGSPPRAFDPRETDQAFYQYPSPPAGGGSQPGSGAGGAGGNALNSGPEQMLGCGGDSRGSMSGFGLTGARGQLYMSPPNAFDTWNTCGKPQRRLSALARNSMGVVFAVADGQLWKVNAFSGGTSDDASIWAPVVRLQYEGIPCNVHDLCFSQWLERGEALYGLLDPPATTSANDEPYVNGMGNTSICRVDIATGTVKIICHLNKGRVDALVAPPLTGGPWHRLVFLFWARGQGMYGVHWANEQFSVRPLITGSQMGQAGIRGLAFDRSDQLFGAGSSLWRMQPFAHTLQRIGPLNNSLTSFCFVSAPRGGGGSSRGGVGGELTSGLRGGLGSGNRQPWMRDLRGPAMY